MRTQGINLHAPTTAFPYPLFFETKRKGRRRLRKRSSRRISGSNDPPDYRSTSEKRVKKEKGEENRMHATSVREFLFRESTRLFPREISRKRERERESLSRRGRDLWMKIVDGTSVEENTFDRARIDRLSDFCPIFSFRCRFQCVYVAHFWGNLMTFLSCYLVFLGESLLSFWSYEFIVIKLEGREI